MANGRYAPWNDELRAADDGRYATIGSYTPDMEITTSCRNLLMSRLKAAEHLNSQLTTNPTEHLHHTVHPPSSRCSIDLAIEQLRAQLVVLIGMDIEVIRQLLTASEQMEEIKWQRKFGVGDSSCTPSSYLSESCTIDTDGNDLDPLTDYSVSKYATMSSVSTYRGSQDDPTDRYGHLRFHRQVNGHFGHDVTRHADDGYLDDAADDVFHTDDDAPQNGPAKPDVTCQSRDVTVNAAQNDSKVKNPDYDKDKVKSTKIEFRIQDADDKVNRSKVELKINNSKDAQDDAKQVQPGVMTSAASDIKAKVKTSKVEFKVDNPKEGSLSKKLTSSQVEIRFKLQPKDAKSSRPEDGSHWSQPVDMSSRLLKEEHSSEFPSKKQDTKYGRPGLPVRKMMQASLEKEAKKPISNTTTAQLQPKTGHAQAEGKHTTMKDASLPPTSEKRTERKEIVVVHL